MRHKTRRYNDLQITYDTDAITALRKAKVYLLHDNLNRQDNFLRALHVARGNPSPHIYVKMGRIP